MVKIVSGVKRSAISDTILTDILAFKGLKAPPTYWGVPYYVLLEKLPENLFDRHFPKAKSTAS